METKDAEQPSGNERIRGVPGSAFAVWILMPVAFLSMAIPCLWMGALMSVRCERVPSTAGDPPGARGVSITVERRLLGVISISKTTLPNVVGVGSFNSPAGQVRRGSSGDIGAVLTLRLADGRTWNAPPAYAPLGTSPWKMGRQIARFIEDPSAQPLSFWCVSWMLHLAAAPLLLVGVLSAYSGLRSLMLLRSAGQVGTED
jgi:hypothetical protein